MLKSYNTKPSVLIGETRTRFFMGNKFHFERVGRGEWKCTNKGDYIIPACLMKEIETWG